MIFQDAGSPMLKLTTRMISIPDTASQFLLKLQSNIPWQLKSKPDWVFGAQPLSDSSYMLRENTLKISFESNSSYIQRKGVIVWKGNNQTDSIEVVQDSKQVNLPENWKVKPTNAIHQVLIYKKYMQET